MEKEYKQFVINSLYGLIEGSAISLQTHMISYFKQRFGFDADNIIVGHTNRFTIDESDFKGAWIGTMTVTLIINGESFSHTRDWGSEYEIDVKHPDYDTDDWFYESDKCQSHVKAQEVYKQIEENII